jgi:hypothetical protein
MTLEAIGEAVGRTGEILGRPWPPVRLSSRDASMLDCIWRTRLARLATPAHAREVGSISRADSVANSEKQAREPDA